jgi:hypothetical protein
MRRQAVFLFASLLYVVAMLLYMRRRPSRGRLVGGWRKEGGDKVGPH